MLTIMDLFCRVGLKSFEDIFDSFENIFDSFEDIFKQLIFFQNAVLTYKNYSNI